MTYANSSIMLEWLENQLVRVLNGLPGVLGMDFVSGDKTDEFLETCCPHHIMQSIIPGTSTRLVQPFP